jgi:hypothetical protein
MSTDESGIPTNDPTDRVRTKRDGRNPFPTEHDYIYACVSPDVNDISFYLVCAFDPSPLKDTFIVNFN